MLMTVPFWDILFVGFGLGVVVCAITINFIYKYSKGKSK
jgi:hypothetical protein